MGSSKSRLQLAGYELVISTSPSIANRVAAPADALHLCYLPPHCEDHRAPELLPLGKAPCRMRPLEVHPMHSPLNLEGLKPHDFLATYRRDPFPTPGVTHFIAASEGVREYFRPLLAQPCPVIYPPIDTSYFRPGQEVREGFYLLVCRGPLTARIQLAVQACQAAKRELLILGLDGHGRALLGVHAHVQCLEDASDAARRSSYHRCRGVLVPSISDFDPVVIEAQACGAPVIAFHSSGNAETLIDAECSGLGTGIFFHEPTVWSLASAIFELERRPHKLSPALGWAQATRFSQTHFELAIRSYVECLVAAQHPLATERRDSLSGIRSAA